MDAQQRHVVIDDVEILGPTRPRSPSCARAASTTAAIPWSRSSTMRVVGPFDAACRTRSPATRSRSSPGRPSWRGAFAEIGPVVVHTCDCGGPRVRACRLSSWRGPRSCARTGGIVAPTTMWSSSNRMGRCRPCFPTCSPASLWTSCWSATSRRAATASPHGDPRQGLWVIYWANSGDGRPQPPEHGVHLPMTCTAPDRDQATKVRSTNRNQLVRRSMVGCCPIVELRQYELRLPAATS